MIDGAKTERTWNDGSTHRVPVSNGNCGCCGGRHGGLRDTLCYFPAIVGEGRAVKGGVETDEADMPTISIDKSTLRRASFLE